MDIPSKPDTSEVAKWLRLIVTGEEQEIRPPLSPIEKWLAYIAEHGIGGGTTKGYYYNGSFYSDAAHTQPITPETGKFYFDLSEGKTYVYDGTAFVMLDEETSDFDAAQMLYDTDFVNPVAKDDDTLFLNGDKILIY